MKVYINNYKSHWISPYTILEKIYFWREIDYDEPLIKKLNKIFEPISLFIQWVLDKLDRKIDYVKIDRWDTWSMDFTLSMIILPMLKQLQASKNGSPNVDDMDVPEYLRSYMAQPKEHEWDADDLWHKRWEWVLGEMIFAFEKLNEDDWEKDFFINKEWKKEEWAKVNDRINNGLVLFGKYYRGLWD